MRYAADVGALARKDLLLELRAKETLPSMLLFVIAALTIFHFALPTGTSDVAARGLLWSALIFTALLGLTRAAAKELGRFGITVNAVCPGMIDTELTHENATPELLARLAASYPVRRLGTALEVADLICFAASEAAGYITGTSLDINGGDLMM